MDTKLDYFRNQTAKCGYFMEDAKWYQEVNMLYNAEGTDCYKVYNEDFKAVVTVKEKEVCVMALYFFLNEETLRVFVSCVKEYAIKHQINIRFMSIMEADTRKLFSRISGFSQVRNTFDIVWKY